MEVFPSYGSSSATPALPIPSSLQPARVSTAANLSYASVTTGGIFQLAGATTYFGLRFSGEAAHHALQFRQQGAVAGIPDGKAGLANAEASSQGTMYASLLS